MSEKHLQGAKKAFFVALGVDIAVTALVVVSNFWSVDVLRKIDASGSLTSQSVISYIEFWENFSKLVLLTMFGVGWTLTLWLGACYKHIRECLKATDLRQEKWKLWGWIVPFLSIFKPYQVLNEIYKVGNAVGGKSDDWKNVSGSWLLFSWWIFWVLSHMAMFTIAKAILNDSSNVGLTIPQVVGIRESQIVLGIISVVVAGTWFIVAGNLTGHLLKLSSKPFRHVLSSNSETPAGNEAYAAALAEIEEGRLDKGTWARSFAESGGDESKAKALYITARVAAIGNEAVWVNTQPPVSEHASPPQSRSNSDVPSGGYEPGRANGKTDSGSKSGISKNLVWSDVILIGVVAAVGYILYQEITKPQVMVASAVQVPAPQSNPFSDSNFGKTDPIDAQKSFTYEVATAEQQTPQGTTGQAEKFVDEAPNPSSWDSYVQKVNGLEAAVSRGELPQADGVVSFGQQRYSTQWPSADAAALESGQTWWRNGSGNDFHIHIKNSTPNSLTVLGLEYSESGCDSNGERIRFFVTLPKPLATGAQSVVHFKPELTVSKKKNNCLAIFSAA